MHVATSSSSCGFVDDVPVDPPRGSLPAVVIKRESEKPVNGNAALVRVCDDIVNCGVLISYLFLPCCFLSDSVRRNIFPAIGTLGEIVPDHLASTRVWVVAVGFVPLGVRVSYKSVFHGLDRSVEQVGGDGSRSSERVAVEERRGGLGRGGLVIVGSGWVRGCFHLRKAAHLWWFLLFLLFFVNVRLTKFAK
jgi:hypothetical protein